MRKLMWAGIGFVGACLVGAYLVSGDGLLIFGLCALAVSVGLLLLQKGDVIKIIATVALGIAIGFIWFYLFCRIGLNDAKAVDGSTLYVQAEATDYSYDTDYGTAVEAEVTVNGKTFGSRVYLNESVQLSPGDLIKGEFNLKFTGPGGQKAQEYYSESGVFLLAYQREEVTVTHRDDHSLRHFAARLRTQVLNKIEEIFPEDTAAFAKALLLGDRRDLDYTVSSELSSSGIIHLIAVSGLHVSVLFSLVFFLCGRRRILTPIVGSAVLLFVAAITGFTPSVMRACLMNWLLLMALAVDKEADGPTALVFAVGVMLFLNPLSVTSVALQLSAFSVVGLMLLSEPISNWVRRLPFWESAKRRTLLARVRNTVAASVGASIGATVATVPLTAMYFGSVSIVGLITNLLTVSLANTLFVLLIVAVILGFVWVPAGAGLAWALSWGIRYILLVSHLLASIPIACVYTCSVYVVVWIVFCYIALAIYCLNKRKSFWQLALFVAVTLAVALTISYAEPLLDNCRVTVVDVGQGQCVLLRSDGKTYMVDCGGDTDKIAADRAIAQLRSEGVFTLDGLILTHYDEDHVGGAQYLMSRMEVGTVYLPEGTDRELWYDRICAAAKDAVVLVDEDTSIQWDNTTISLYVSEYLETSNESGMCVLFQRENCDILITGDRTSAGEMDLLMKHDLPRLDVLIAGHHGSRSSTSEYLLSRTTPDTVVISVGEGNAYGHPSDETLQRLQRYGCVVRRTDLEGTIVIRR